MPKSLATFLARSPLPPGTTATAVSGDVLVCCPSPAVAGQVWMQGAALRSAFAAGFDRLIIAEPSRLVVFRCATWAALELELEAGDRRFGR